MAKARAIIKRRKAVKNIAKITKTMNMIATARFKKALDRAVAARPYTDKLKELLADLASAGLEYSHPLLTKHERQAKTTILVVTSNRGLAGGYNANLLREANQLIKAEKEAGREVTLDVAGKRGINFFRFSGVPVRKTYLNFDDKPRYEEVEPIAKGFIEDYTSGAADRVFVVYMKFFSAGRQKPVAVQLLPLDTSTPADAKTADAAKAKTAAGKKKDYLFFPDAAGLLDELIPQSLKISLFQGFLDAAVSEQVFRMVAMKAATDNANDLVKTLTMKYNRARQSQITTELAEIMGGAAAISG
jgi:F-type H+-transporting ATPase subunit gamma